MSPLNEIPRTLNSFNIDEAITNYLGLLNQIPIQVEAGNVLELLSKIKRKKVSLGPYPDVTLFEAANRIMTDLTIMFGVKELLNGRIPVLTFDEYKVELGNENHNKHDIEASKDGLVLYGEAFNVADSFFQVKKAASLKKLRGSASDKAVLILIYNSDAVKESYVPKLTENTYHLAVEVPF